jgi:ribosome-interacting GTPase 1
VLEYEGARIQLLDLPGIVEGAAMGRGRGRQVVSVAKTADVIIIMSKHCCWVDDETRALTGDACGVISGCYQVE